MLACRKNIEEIETGEHRSGKTSFVFLEVDYKMIYSGIIFKDFSPFLETFNEMIGRFTVSWKVGEKIGFMS